MNLTLFKLKLYFKYRLPEKLFRLSNYLFKNKPQFQKEIDNLIKDNYRLSILYASLLSTKQYNVGDTVYYSTDNGWREFKITGIDRYHILSNSSTMTIPSLKLNDRDIISKSMQQYYPAKFELFERNLCLSLRHKID